MSDYHRKSNRSHLNSGRGEVSPSPVETSPHRSSRMESVAFFCFQNSSKSCIYPDGKELSLKAILSELIITLFLIDMWLKNRTVSDHLYFEFSGLHVYRDKGVVFDQCPCSVKTRERFRRHDYSARPFILILETPIGKVLIRRN